MRETEKMKKQKGYENQCKTCKYHDDWTWVCFNPESDDRADFTDNEYMCPQWLGKEEIL